MKGCEKNMKFTVLMEDTCGNPCCEYEHGLCIYMETKKHKLPVQFYTGHCTGEEAMELMEEIMQDRLIRIHCGAQFHL